MNVVEGSRRMRRAGRWMVLIPISIFVPFLFLSEAFATLRMGDFVNWFGILQLLAPLLLIIAIPGGALWLAGWILDGFARDSD